MSVRRGACVLLGALVVPVLVLLVACGDDRGRPDGSGGTVTVFAAASLTDAFAAVADAFEHEHPGVRVVLNFGPSSGLREQVLAGAPADVFASANPGNMDQLVSAGAAEASAVFATNSLTIAVPEGNPGGVAGLADFADPDLFIGLCAEQVPCGDFARRALAAAGVEPSLDTNATDVRALLTQISSGDLDAGIVYRTDLRGAAGVEGVAIGSADDVTAEYPIARLVDAGRADLADAFVAFVRSGEGEGILASFGFGSP